MIKFQVTMERKERDVWEVQLTPEKYQEFLELRRSENTAQLGEWLLNNNVTVPPRHVDSYGSDDSEAVTIYNAFENEYIQD